MAATLARPTSRPGAWRLPRGGRGSATVGNADFASPVLAAYTYAYTPAGTAPWTFTGGAAIATAYSAFMADAEPMPPVGNQVAVLQGIASISQVVNFPTAGTFTINFLSAARTFGAGVNPFVFSVDGTSYGSFMPTNTASFANYTSDSFTVTAGNHTIEFAGADMNGDCSSYIAEVSIAVVDPPAETAPAVTANPASQTVTAGATASFSATASGTPTPTVQWQVSTNGGSTFTNISGATSSPYTFAPAPRSRATFTAPPLATA